MFASSRYTGYGGVDYTSLNDAGIDYEDWLEPRVETEDEPIVCPFQPDLKCDQGCQVCDSPNNDGTYVAKCCGYTDMCKYTSQCEIPCSASSQFQGEGVGCMYCGKGKGLIPCTASTPPCTFDNRCTANTKKKYERPDDKPEYNRGDEQDIIHVGRDGKVVPVIKPEENVHLGAVANYYSSTMKPRSKMSKKQQQQFMQQVVRNQQLAMSNYDQQHARLNYARIESRNINFWYS